MKLYLFPLKLKCYSEINPRVVLVATTLGEGGKGGIDRMMDELRRALSTCQINDLRVEFMATRGQRHIGFAFYYLWRFIARMAYLRFKGNLALVHINLSSDGSTWRKLIVAGVSRLFGTPYIIHLHSGRYPQFLQRLSNWRRQLVLNMFSHASRILVLGTVWRDFVASEIPSARDRIVILPNATRKRFTSPLREDNIVEILFLGRLGENKGTHYLIQSLSQLILISGWRAILAGDGEVQSSKNLARQLGLRSRIQFPGWIGPDQVECLLCNADILVLPSLCENLPMSVVEGMGAGLAVIATPVGAVGDIIKDEDTGILVAPGDVAALTAALRRLIDDKALRKRLGVRAAAFHLQNLEISNYASRLCEIWKAETL